MASSNALVPRSGSGGGGGPQWQVDIPGLSQLIFSAGSYGLKQLALSGVDPHTIGCMLMIAEYTPASKEFRTVLARSREQQRAERVWMYKIVEIGASTNFLADQMLKTRAGENVLALMSASVSVMEEDSSVALLSSLFEAANVSLDNIPGTSQLQSIRNNLAPLARKTGFREKVLHYHHFLSSLINPRAGLRVLEGDPYDAIPVAVEIPLIIRMLHKLTTSEDPYVLIFRGFRGAAWTAAYACYVLGLHSCALDLNGTPVPITGTYEDATVILDLSASENKCEMYLQGEMQEIVAFDRSRSRVHGGWSIDCSVTNFVELHHPGLKKNTWFSRVSNFAAIEAINAVSNLSSSFDQFTIDSMWLAGQKDLAPLGFVTYTKSVLPDLQHRCLRILSILGFRPDFDGYRFEEQEECPRFRCLGHVTDPPPVYEETDEEYYNYETRRREKQRLVTRRGQYLGARLLQFVKNEGCERLRYYLDDPNNPEINAFLNWPNEFQFELARSIEIAVDFASRLAFTDWDTSLQMMSVRAMSYREPYQIGGSNTAFEGHMTEAITLCSDGVDKQALEKRLWSEDWIALDLDGIVVFRNASRLHSITDLRGKYLNFCSGRIMYDNGQYYKIRTDRIGTLAYNLSMGSKAETSPEKLTPIDAFSTIKARPLFTNAKDTIFVRLEVYIRSNLALLADSSIVARQVPTLLVSTPCSHGFFGNSVLLGNNKPYDFIDYLHEGISFDDKKQAGRSPNSSLKRGANIFYQQTSHNPFAQWLACQWQPTKTDDGKRGLMILQKDCCVGCIFRRLEKIINSLRASPASILPGGYPVCIIGGTQEKTQSRRDATSLCPPKPAYRRSSSVNSPPASKMPIRRKPSPSPGFLSPGPSDPPNYPPPRPPRRSFGDQNTAPRPGFS